MNTSCLLSLLSAHVKPRKALKNGTLKQFQNFCIKKSTKWFPSNFKYKTVGMTRSLFPSYLLSTNQPFFSNASGITDTAVYRDEVSLTSYKDHFWFYTVHIWFLSTILVWSQRNHIWSFVCLPRLLNFFSWFYIFMFTDEASLIWISVITLVRQKNLQCNT